VELWRFNLPGIWIIVICKFANTSLLTEMHIQEAMPFVLELHMHVSVVNDMLHRRTKNVGMGPNPWNPPGEDLSYLTGSSSA